MSKGEYLQFGGMAVPEGVMMRSPHYYAVACRAPNDEIIVKTAPLEDTWIGRQKWLKKPFLRGTLALLDTMALGMKAMNWATGVHLDPRYQPADAEVEVLSEKDAKKKKVSESIQIAIAVVVSLAFGFVIFKAIPEFVAQLTLQGADEKGYWTNLVAGLVKMIFFVGYLALIRKIPNVYEVFRYHGAEHQAINAHEAGEALNAESCLKQTRLHPRCGTNFAIIVLVIGFAILLFIPRYPVINGYQIGKTGVGIVDLLQTVGLRIVWELILLPLIAGISYEVIRAAGKAKDQKWVEILLKPGLATQLITTAEPAEKHAEVAIRSLLAVINAEEHGTLENTDPTAKDIDERADDRMDPDVPEDVIT